MVTRSFFNTRWTAFSKSRTSRPLAANEDVTNGHVHPVGIKGDPGAAQGGQDPAPVGIGPVEGRFK